MWFLLCRDGRELDYCVGFFHQLFEHGCCIVCDGRVTLKQLLGSHHDLVGSLASTASPTHPVGHNAQHATCNAGVTKERHLILLVVTVTLVDAG